LVLEIKKRNPSYGYPKIALLVSHSTGISISEQTVRMILRTNLKPNPGDGPSWQSFIGNQVDSLWSLDLFRCESIHLRSFWVMVVMDVYSRKIIGYSIQAKACTGESLCRMLGEILSTSANIPKRVVCDNDLLFRYHQWQANFRLSEIAEIKSVPEIPWSESLCRESYRVHTKRVHRSDPILERGRSQSKVGVLPEIFQ
jgi:putative transposase